MLTATGLGNFLAPCISEATRDEELRHAATAVLRSSGYGLLRSLECEVNGGVVTISGVLPSFYLKQLAQALLLRLDGLQGVSNEVEVRAGT